MFNLFDIVVKKRRYLFVEEENVMTTLKVLDDVNRSSRFDHSMDMEISNLGYIDKPDSWFIHFDATNKKWKSIIAALKKEGYKIMLGEDGWFYLI